MQRPPRNWPLDLTRVGLLAGAVFLHAVIGVSLAATWGTDEFARRDWSAFRDAGHAAATGEVQGMYDARPGGFPYLHPPWVAALLAPVGDLDDGAFYGVMVALQLLGLAMVVLALRHLEPDHTEKDLVLLGVLASAPWAIGLVLGQPSALVLGAWLLAYWAVDRKEPFVAGLLFGLCVIKPPYVVAPIIYSLLSRRYRVLAGIAASLGVLLALSLSVGQWTEWVAAVSRTLGNVSTGDVALWKQQTFLAFLRGVMPRTAALLIWGLACVVSAWLFYRVRHSRMPMLRVAGWLALGTIALSPFAYFYDALILTLPAAALWLRWDTYPARFRPILVGLSVGTFVLQHIGFFVLQQGTPLTGLLVLAWLVVEFTAISKERLEAGRPARSAA